MMITRTAKLLLVAALALFHSLVVFNNLTDFDSNYQFVRHVLAMDSTFSASHTHWRAIGAPAIHLAFYWLIIAWEAVVAIVLWWGALHLLRAVRTSAALFHAAKGIPVLGLTLSLLLWLVAFLSIGGEWFLMWQSQAWNGQQEAFRMFVIVGLVLLILIQPETEAQA